MSGGGGSGIGCGLGAHFVPKVKLLSVGGTVTAPGADAPSLLRYRLLRTDPAALELGPAGCCFCFAAIAQSLS